MTTDKMEFSRDELIAICRDAVVPQVAYGRRDADLLAASGLEGTYVSGWWNRQESAS